MRGRAQGQALPDDPAIGVVLGVRHRREAFPDLLDGPPGRGGELVDGDGFTVGEQFQQRDQQGRVQSGLL